MNVWFMYIAGINVEICVEIGSFLLWMWTNLSKRTFLEPRICVRILTKMNKICYYIFITSAARACAFFPPRLTEAVTFTMLILKSSIVQIVTEIHCGHANNVLLWTDFYFPTNPSPRSYLIYLHDRHQYVKHFEHSSNPKSMCVFPLIIIFAAFFKRILLIANELKKSVF